MSPENVNPNEDFDSAFAFVRKVTKLPESVFGTEFGLSCGHTVTITSHRAFGSCPCCHERLMFCPQCASETKAHRG